MSRREELIQAAADLFAKRGFDGVSVADIVTAVEMSKAAFGYHLESKEQLLFELVDPLLLELEAVVDGYPHTPEFPGELELMIADFVAALVRHRQLTIWIDGDKAVHSHPIVGKRLMAINQGMRKAIRGDLRSAESRVLASAALGSMWRPIRNLLEIDMGQQSGAIIEATLAVVTVVRSK